MLTIYFNDKTKIEWEKGSRISFNIIELFSIKFIVVNAKELEYVRQYFTPSFSNSCTLPFSDVGDEMIWTGDIAKTVIANVFYISLK